MIKQNNPTEYGKVPPQAVDIEEAVLGACILDKEAPYIAISILIPEDFYKEQNQKVFSAISELCSNNKPVDMLTVSNKLREMKELESVGGPFYISNLTNSVASGAYIEYHARLVKEKSIKRNLISIGLKCQNDAYDESIDIETILSDVSKGLDSLSQTKEESSASMKELSSQSMRDTEKRNVLYKEGKITGIPTPFQVLNKYTNGFQPKNFIIVAARPSMGKTSFSITLARTMAEYGFAGIYFSIEMPKERISDRMICSKSGFDYERYRNGNVYPNEWSELDAAASDISKLPIIVDDTSSPTLNYIVSRINFFYRKGLCKWVIIDYLQLIKVFVSKNANREQEVANISRTLQGLSKKLDIPIIALAQLNRSVESRTGNKRPQLSDLRESGAIEQDADLVMLLHRPAYYGIEDTGDGESTEGLMEVIVCKNREGKIGPIKTRHNPTVTTFSDWDMIPQQKINEHPDVRIESQTMSANTDFENEVPF